MDELTWDLDPDRYFSPNLARRKVARELYQTVADVPIVSPHGHVDPALFVDPDATFGTPAELFIIPDHYVFRMLYSQGIQLESLGVVPADKRGAVTDHRQVWQTFAENFYLFRGTPTGIWLAEALIDVFGISSRLTGQTAQRIYDQIEDSLASPAFRPRALFDRFNIEVLSTTDAATDTLEDHKRIRDSGWGGDIRPTFRPDGLVHLLADGWSSNIDALGNVGGIAVHSYGSFIHALENRREFFKAMGATATDHGSDSACTAPLAAGEADAIFQRALRGEATQSDAKRFSGHMMMEFARMSIEDGLVMQFHVGSFRNHNRSLFVRFGPDAGADIPQRSEFTNNLRPLLNEYGNDPRLTFIVFTLDESTYARELAPLAGHYPAMKIGPPWWFYDSLNGMQRYFDRVVETAGLYNTVGFNDDTRAFPSIPVRHNVWRRASADWIAGLVVRGVVDMVDAHAMILDSAYSLAKRTYRYGED